VSTELGAVHNGEFGKEWKRGMKRKEKTSLLSHTIESTLSCMTLNEVLHMGKGGHPKGGGAEMRNERKQKKERVHTNERNGEMDHKDHLPSKAR
jgi:hypothetical protein